jgi:hypothetical protein
MIPQVKRRRKVLISTYCPNGLLSKIQGDKKRILFSTFITLYLEKEAI